MKYHFSTVILAAGVGKRMHSKKPKVLHRILGSPIISFVVRTAQMLGTDEIIVVVGKDSGTVKKELGNALRYALQSEPKGTGDAARCGLDAVKNEHVLILCGDVPLLTEKTLMQIIRHYEKTSADLTLLTCHMDDPYGYGRIIRNEHGGITGIVEQSDANDAEAHIQEINAGVYFGSTNEISEALQHISTRNNQGELYLTDIIGFMINDGKTVTAHMIKEQDEIMGINTKVQLARAREIVRIRWLEELMLRGVYIEDPATTIIDLAVNIGSNVHIRPFVIIEGKTSIADGVTVGPYTWIKDGKKQSIPGAG
ncbi:MAG: bifunctional N-acetylglucosamine-1-phosphate uridyltransferase/glucosamine-1-phosphate acetyltransferase [candidate division WOR-3 bacterium]|nr:MAG: bifunctional N-acetylglucosamine-1-phosphate uridyltransferase/glucosamine-1-phosphate acetyltransferase [candidate division WOR-3 bacterium]